MQGTYSRPYIEYLCPVNKKKSPAILHVCKTTGDLCVLSID